MSITVRENPDQNRYEALDDAGDGTGGAVVGFVEYVDHRGVRVLFHTEVDDAVEGQGVGSQLAQSVLDAVTGAGLDTRTTCPFLVDWVEKHPDYKGKVTLG